MIDWPDTMGPEGHAAFKMEADRKARSQCVKMVNNIATASDKLDPKDKENFSPPTSGVLDELFNAMGTIKYVWPLLDENPAEKIKDEELAEGVKIAYLDEYYGYVEDALANMVVKFQREQEGRKLSTFVSVSHLGKTEEQKWTPQEMVEGLKELNGFFERNLLSKIGFSQLLRLVLKIDALWYIGEKLGESAPIDLFRKESWWKTEMEPFPIIDDVKSKLLHIMRSFSSNSR